MKTKKKMCFDELPCSKLYLEDITKLDKIYRENMETYTLETDDYELDSIDELEKIGKDGTHRLSFLSFSPYVHLEMSGLQTRLSYYDDVKSLGIVSKLKDVLKTTTNPIRHLTGNVITNTVPVASIFTFGLLYSIEKNHSLFICFGILLFLMVVLYWGSSYYFCMRCQTIIYLRNREQKMKFLHRNKDQILLLIIGGIITLVLIKGLPWIWEIIWK